MPKTIAVMPTLKDCEYQLDLENQPEIRVRECVPGLKFTIMEKQLAQEWKVCRAGFEEVNPKGVIEYNLEYKNEEVEQDPLGREVS